MSSDDVDCKVSSTHRRAVIIGGVTPVAIALAATLLTVSWLPELPDPIAVHWSGAGPDGFGAALPFVLAPVLVVLAYCVFVVVMTWRLAPSGLLSYSQKFLLVSGVWMSALLSVGFGAGVAVQRGLSDAHNAPDMGLFAALGAGAGLLLAVGAWFVLPKGVVTPTRGQTPQPVDIRGDERLSWSRSTRFGNVPLILIILTLAVVIGSLVFAFVTTRQIPVIAVIILAIVAVFVMTTAWWRVSADRRGFTVRGVMGWPVKSITLEDIRTVQVVEVHPMRDFGGYGWRWTGGGRSGVVLRNGPGIEVTASSGKRFVVSVDDAETGAGVLAALLTQHAAR